MPIYQYKCQKCGSVFDRIRSVLASQAQAICSPCDALADKVLTVPASIRMGTGTTRRDSGMNRTEV